MRTYFNYTDDYGNDVYDEFNVATGITVWAILDRWNGVRVTGNSEEDAWERAASYIRNDPRMHAEQIIVYYS